MTMSTQWQQYVLAGSIAFLLTCSPAWAAEQVVVVPLGGATGDAQAGDVLVDKTFSSDAGKGLTGIRPPSVPAVTGAVSTGYANDDASYSATVGGSVTDRFPSPYYVLGQGRYDPLTGLYWEIDPPYLGNQSLETAINRCEALETGFSIFLTYSDWRLPNLNELLSLIDRGNYNPALPDGFQTTFEGGTTLSGQFWTSTPYPIGSNAWLVDLGTGNIDLDGFNTAHFSICVRGGQQ